MWCFCLHSAVREYGWQFLARVALPHPWRTVRAALQSGRIDYGQEAVPVPDAASCEAAGDGLLQRGDGFCMKPTDLVCVSGRFTHACQFL